MRLRVLRFVYDHGMFNLMAVIVMYFQIAKKNKTVQSSIRLERKNERKKYLSLGFRLTDAINSIHSHENLLIFFFEVT